MGNDGGSIPTRIELVKEARKAATTTEVKAARREKLEYGWSTDPLSRRPLVAPVVSDCAGVLYRKESVINYLLQLAGRQADDHSDGNGNGTGHDDSGVTLADAQSVIQGRIKSLKDVVEVKFDDSTEEDIAGSKNGKGGENTQAPRWICPVSRKEFGPGVKAVYIVPCGHAFTAAAIKELDNETRGKCLQCDSEYSSLNVIPILPTDPVDIEFLALRASSLAKNNLTHSLKKGEKKKKRSREGGGETGGQPNDSGAELKNGKSTSKDPDGPPPSKIAKRPTAASSRSIIQDATTAAITARVLKEQEESKKARQGRTSKAISSLFSESNQTPDAAKKNTDFMTRGFTYTR